MKIERPSFGIISGMATGLGLAPHLLVLIALFIFRPPAATTISIVIFTIGSKLLGEWLFCNFFINRMDGVNGLRNWRRGVSTSLFSHPNVSLSVLFFISDHVCDIFLLHAALQTRLYPALIFLIFLGCQAVASFFQGVVSDIVSLKKTILFSLCVAMFVQVGLVFFGSTSSTTAFHQFTEFSGSTIGINLLDPANQMLLLLVIKGLFGNTSTVARSGVANVIFSRVVRKLEEGSA